MKNSIQILLKTERNLLLNNKLKFNSQIGKLNSRVIAVNDMTHDWPKYHNLLGMLCFFSFNFSIFLKIKIKKNPSFGFHAFLGKWNNNCFSFANKFHHFLVFKEKNMKIVFHFMGKTFSYFLFVCLTSFSLKQTEIILYFQECLDKI